jgi:hypothetical protein
MNSWWLIGSMLAGVAPQGAPSNPAAPWNLSFHGDASALVSVFPRQGDDRELRTRLLVTATADPARWLRLHLEGTAEGLVAHRGGRVDDVVVNAREAWIEVRGRSAEVRAGYGRLVWGRLDEVMPSDVINPIDTAKFFLSGRAEARLPLAFVRSRVFLPAQTSVEMVAALPGRRGRFDVLDDDSSPFNLLNDLRVRRETPAASWKNVQGGMRVSSTVGRVDMSVSAWRGFESFGVVSIEPLGGLVERYPRFTMIAADAETVRGGWAIRGEAAAFVDKTLSRPFGPVQGKAIDAGVGVDRAAGDYRVFGSVVWHREWSAVLPDATESYVNLIASVERQFSRDRYMARVFGVLNPEDRSGFVRGLVSWSVRDNVLLEGSGGIFMGEGTDTISRFTDRDFVFLRVRYHF